ncbi:MAG: ChuX/HutX family heme-like substrate-binding protein [Bacteroidota bacterium]
MKNLDTLIKQLQALKEAEPKLRNRDLARKLHISEAELLSLSAGENVTRLEGDWKELLKGIKDMGYVMALTRNEHCVHERKGVYDNIEFYGGMHNMGVAVNPDIDLRFFMNEWVYALAVIMERPNGELYSFQFFNKKGEAVHKIFSTPKSDIEAYHKLVEKFKAEHQLPFMEVDNTPYEEKTLHPDSEIDVESFQQSWKELKDTHDFFGLLRKYKVSRTQGFRLAPEGFTQQIDNESVVKTLEKASETGTPIMCFLHSKGCVQIHSGPVKKLKFYGDWYNVLDPKFNLHLSMPAVRESWIVKKPTVDGIVTSLELFDKEGNQIVYFFGARKPGKPELETWRDIIAEVQKEHQLLNTA